VGPKKFVSKPTFIPTYGMKTGTGMDEYGYNLFPLYVWSFVGLIIVGREYSPRIAIYIFGSNPVAVPATLFLLSYSKFLRTI